jgi:hypothetical protein
MARHNCDICGIYMKCFGKDCLVCENEGDVCTDCFCAYYSTSCVACQERTPECRCEQPPDDPVYDHPRPLHGVPPGPIGTTCCVFAGAPGTGRVVYYRVTETRAYEIENTIRELAPWEVI